MKLSFQFFLVCLFPAFALAAQVTITGKPISLNGETEIPKAIFGVHAGNFQGFSDKLVSDWGIESSRHIQIIGGNSPASTKAGIQDVVTCWFDRFEPARQLKSSNWKNDLGKMARSFAGAANGSSLMHHLEFWNEPYLNWAYKPGVNMDPQWFKQPAGLSEGDPVVVTGSSEALKHFQWQKAQWYRSDYWTGNTANIYNLISWAWNDQLGKKGVPYPGLDGALLKGEYYVKKDGSGTVKYDFTVVDSLRPVDSTQKDYYSGLGNMELYSEQLQVVADSLKAHTDKVKLVAGWGFQPQHSDWHVWHTLYKPIIDRHHAQIDGIDEHHYGGDTRDMQGVYETIYAYSLRKHGKRYRFYNTETGGDLDPQTPEGATAPPDTDPTPKAMKAFTYNVRDMLYMVSRSPDKAFARAVHEPQNTEGGVEQAFRFLKPLRGELIQSESSDNGVLSVAAKNGGSYAVYLFNGNPEATSVELDIGAPAGQSLSNGKMLQPHLSGSTVSISSSSLSLSGGKLQKTVEMPALSALGFTFELSGSAESTTPVSYVQFFADSILIKAPAGGAATVGLPIDAEALGKAKSARLKYVLPEFEGGKLELNGKGVDATSGKGSRYANLNLSDLKESNTLTLTAGGAKRSFLWMASVELIGESLPITVANIPVSPVSSLARDLSVATMPSGALRVRLQGDGQMGDFSAELFSLTGTRVDAARGRGELLLRTDRASTGLHLLRIRQGGQQMMRRVFLRGS